MYFLGRAAGFTLHVAHHSLDLLDACLTRFGFNNIIGNISKWTYHIVNINHRILAIPTKTMGTKQIGSSNTKGWTVEKLLADPSRAIVLLTFTTLQLASKMLSSQLILTPGKSLKYLA